MASASFSPSPLLVTINKILGQSDGKDKLLRLIQFAMRFLAWSSPVPSAAGRIQDAIMTSRKWFRVLRSLESLAKAQLVVSKLTGNKATPPLPYFELLQQCAFFCFFFVDHIFILSKMAVPGIAQLDQGVIRRTFGGTFLTACSAGFAGNVTRVYQTRSLPASRNASPVIRQKRYSAQLENIVDGLKNGMDCVIGANIAYDKNWNNGVIGAVGVTTSTIWLWQLYCNMVYGNALAERLAVPNEEHEE